MSKCRCACCIEKKNRFEHGRDILEACNCHLYPIEEQCDCEFCKMIKDFRRRFV